MDEKDLKQKLPDEPSFKSRKRLSEAKRKEEFDKLPPALRELADLADELSEYYGSEKYTG